MNMETVKIKLTEEGELSNKFKATFTKTDREHYLYINLDAFDDLPFNVGKDWFQFYYPTLANLHVNQEYIIDVDNARQVFTTLVNNGWSNERG